MVVWRTIVPNADLPQGLELILAVARRKRKMFLEPFEETRVRGLEKIEKSG